MNMNIIILVINTGQVIKISKILGIFHKISGVIITNYKAYFLVCICRKYTYKILIIVHNILYYIHSNFTLIQISFNPILSTFVFFAAWYKLIT